MAYHHTQKGFLHHILVVVVALALLGAWFCREQAVLLAVLLLVALAVWGVVFTIMTLTVEDRGDHLLVRFGPLPLLQKRIAYSEITSVEASRSDLLDGWGVHYVPGRGTIYNLWGFDCVKLTLGRKAFRIGTDDVENLVQFLRSKISA